jgi:hypothetical protein
LFPENASSTITFDSASGPLITQQAPSQGITMNFPLNPPDEQVNERTRKS